MSDTARSLYVYVDESGQDNAGTLFVVAAVVVWGDQKEQMESAFVQLERVTKRVGKKWKRTSIARRHAFLQGIGSALEHGQIVWARWNGKQYIEAVAQTVVRAVQRLDAHGRLTVVIDGLKEKERDVVSRVFRAAGVRFRKIVLECRDETCPLLRLADATAGFVRDVEEGQEYARVAWRNVGSLFVQV